MGKVSRSRLLTPRKRAAIAWSSVGGLAVLTSATLAAPANWVADLIASLAAQWILVGLCLAAALIAVRRYWASACAAALCVVFLLVLLPGRADTLTSAPPPDGVTVRVLHMNANTLNPHGAEILDLILEADADVVSILEAPTELVHLIRDSGAIASRYSPFYMAEGARAGWPIVLTRWPQRGGPDWTPGPLHRTSSPTGEGYVMMVDHPVRPFFMLQAHAMSPRTPRRWTSGTELVARVARRVRTELQPLKTPIILACDLNSPPSGARSRRLVGDSALRRAKPFFNASGTYPSALPWPLSLAIDDLFVSPDVRVVKWSTIRVPGSDHRGVIAELLLNG